MGGFRFAYRLAQECLRLLWELSLWLWAWFWRLHPRERRWIYLAVAVVWGPIIALNLAVDYFGQTTVFPLSPFYLKQKVRALMRYSLHRPVCILFSDAEMEPLIAKAEIRHRIPRGLLGAVIHVESAGLPHRISPTGAMGPAQLIESTARMLGVKDPFDPKEAVDAGGRYLAQNLRRFGNVRLAVAAYNAGPGAVRGGIPRNGETEYYVPRVMAEFQRRSAKFRPAKPRSKAGSIQQASDRKR